MLGLLRGSERTRADQAIDKIRTLFGGCLAVAAVGLVVEGFWGVDRARAVSFVMLNLTAGGAAAIAGGLLGFIFGIPKSLTDDEHLTGRISQPNTNLEQISDWLTKILVGAGLTSLTSLPGFAARLIAYLNQNAYDGLPGGGTLAVFLMVYCAAAGFFWSYIETRTTLTELFVTATSTVSTDLVQIVRLAPWEPGSRAVPEDQEILRLPPESLTTVELLDARGSAELRAGHLDQAIGFLQRAVQMAPSNLPIQRKLALALSSAQRTGEADTLISSVRPAVDRSGNVAERNSLALNELFNELYKPGGYERAIQIGEHLLQTDQASNGNLHLWLACAYGQRAATLRAGSEDFMRDRDQALERLTTMKRLRPDLLPLARSVWRPDEYGGNKTDTDLTVFHDDPDFVALLTGNGG